MKQTSHTIVALLLALSIPVTALAERSNENDAVAFIKKAQDYIRANGAEKASAEFNKPDSPFNNASELNKNGDLYMFGFTLTGLQMFHGKAKKMIGKSMTDLRDPDGTYIVKEMLRNCNSPDGKGWVTYKWVDPVTQNVGLKRSYVEKVPNADLCIGTGIYK